MEYKFKKTPLDIDLNDLNNNPALCEKIEFLILNIIDEDNISFMKVNEIEDLFNQYITENNKLYESADFKYEDFQDEPEEFDVKNLKIDNKTNYDIQSLNVHYNGDLYVIYFVPNFKRPYKYYEGPWKIAPHLYDGNGDFTIETGFFIYIDKLNTLIHENELIKNSLDFDEDDFIYCEIAYNILSEIKEHKNKYFKN